jgi:hypothetical protein
MTGHYGITVNTVCAGQLWIRAFKSSQDNRNTAFDRD